MVTALTGFIGALYQAGILGQNSANVPQPTTVKSVTEQPAVQLNPTQTATPKEPEQQTVAPDSEDNQPVIQAVAADSASEQQPKPNPQPDKIVHLAGHYSVQGKNPKGETCTGRVTIVDQGKFYQLAFHTRGKTFHGKGKLEGDVLQVKWEQRLVTCTRRTNGELEGTWDNGAGNEILVPIGN